jgi:hypothetical protein
LTFLAPDSDVHTTRRSPPRSPAGPLRSLLQRLLGGRRLRDGSFLYWWAELFAIACMYALYVHVKTSSQVSPEIALRNAELLIELERSLFLYHELALQARVLEWPALVVASNYFYGAMHFVVTGSALLALFWKWPDDYRLLRNTLGAMTALAFIGYFAFPLMPPRLLEEFGGPHGFVDTMMAFPTLWTWDSVAGVSNQFAAMPSLHTGWSLWCALVLVPRLRAPWARALAAAYPVATIGVIVWTGNHFFLDAAGGAAVLAAGYGLAHLWARRSSTPALVGDEPQAASWGAT